jgi:hypothetical protein
MTQAGRQEKTKLTRATEREVQPREEKTMREPHAP